MVLTRTAKRKADDIEIELLQNKRELSYSEVEWIVSKIPSFDFVLHDFRHWERVCEKFNSLPKAAFDSPLGCADTDWCVRNHKVYLSLVHPREAMGFQSPFAAHQASDFLLSAAFCDKYLPSHIASFRCQLWPYIRGALASARPHPYRISMLMWHDVNCIEPLITFLDKMLTPIDRSGRLEFLKVSMFGPAHLHLPVELREKIFKMAFNEAYLQLHGNYGVDLVLHFLFFIWGFGSRVTDRDCLRYEGLSDVIRCMQSF